MINGLPNYMCLDTRSILLLRHLSDSDKLIFFDEIINSFFKKAKGVTDFEFEDNMVGDLLSQAVQTMCKGFDSYIDKVNKNPSGKPKDGNPTGTPRVPKGSESNINQTNIYQDNEDQTNQIEKQLIDEGYTKTEISSALIRCKLTEIKNPVAYIRQIIENQRKQNGTNKSVTAQDFPQRDYSGVNEDLYRQLAEEIAQHKLDHPDQF